MYTYPISMYYWGFEPQPQPWGYYTPPPSVVDDDTASTLSTSPSLPPSQYPPRQEPSPSLEWAGSEAGSGKIIGNRCTSCGRLVLPGTEVCHCTKKRESCDDRKALQGEMNRITETNYDIVAPRVRDLAVSRGEEGMCDLVDLMLLQVGAYAPLMGQLSEDMCVWTAQGDKHSEFRTVLLRRCQQDFCEVMETKDPASFARFLCELHWRGIMGTKTLRDCADKLLQGALSDLKAYTYAGSHKVFRTVPLLPKLLARGQLSRPDFADIRDFIEWFVVQEIPTRIRVLLQNLLEGHL